MTKNIHTAIFLAIGLLFFVGRNQAYAAPAIAPPASTADSTATVKEDFFDNGALVMVNDENTVTEGIFDDSKGNLAFSHFTWGAEFGSSIDLTAHNRSTFDLDVNIGFKNSFIKLAGIGTGFHRSVYSGAYYIPVYGIIRTSFRKKPSLLFMNMLFGYSFNKIKGASRHGDMVSALGCGLNLTQSSRAKSYLILSVSTTYFDKDHEEKTGIHGRFGTSVKIQIGINF